MPRLADEGATLGNEAALVRAYLELMLMRMPDRLQFDIDIPPALAGERFPAMALLTLVENAIRHGIDPSEQGGRVRVRAERNATGGFQLLKAAAVAGPRQAAGPGTGPAHSRASRAACA